MIYAINGAAFSIIWDNNFQFLFTIPCNLSYLAGTYDTPLERIVHGTLHQSTDFYVLCTALCNVRTENTKHSSAKYQCNESALASVQVNCTEH